MKKNFYVTTPIYYGNWPVHVGHFYSSTIANTIYKYQKISGSNARFTTGIDENSQKAVIKANEAGVPIMQYLDSMAQSHQKVWNHFNMDYTDFIRTTSQRHKITVQNVLQKCFDKGDIYEGEYEGMYCIWCESFKKDEDLVFRNKTSWDTFPVSDKVKPSENIEKVCPDHLTQPDKIKEKNYFFKLKKYQTWIEEFYEDNPKFVNPDFRYNEVKAFVSRGLEDFSISRETNTFGIKLPFDDTQVTYVWFDALFNYYTSCIKSRAWDKNNEEFIDESKIFWEWNSENKREILHVVWKDIIRFHAIFWPAMLASYFDLGKTDADGVLHYTESDLDYLPNEILTGGYFTVDGQKMSKSIGNVIDPVEYSEKYSKELLTLYMLSAFPIGNDWDYDRKDAVLNFNAKMANNFGNLVNRVVVLTMKLGLENWLFHELTISGEWSYFWRNIENKEISYLWWDIIETIKFDYPRIFDDAMNIYNLKSWLDNTFFFLDTLNKFADTKQPWQTIKDDDKSETIETLYTLAEWVRQVGLNLYAFFPEKMAELFEKLGLENYSERLEKGELEDLRKEKPAFNITEKWSPLFARFEVE